MAWRRRTRSATGSRRRPTSLSCTASSASSAIFNSGVHLTLHYPRMRRCLSAGSLRLLAVAQNPAQFVADYTLSAMHMLRDAKFQLLEWTLPE
jgi:hypothetical protein